ncbi:MAG: ATP-binding protein [Kiritimatiellae bacterium]|nr:ATP-binding protein [Kiritimatiellia bacterium]
MRNWVDGPSKTRLTVLYGRRRIGKTRLVEETFKDVPLLKFEGLENQPTAEQQRVFLRRMAELTGRREYELVKTSHWTDLLILLSDYLAEAFKDSPVVVFLDEFQWLAAGRAQLVSSLKYVWDNYFSKRSAIQLIVCGSVCSFLVRKVLRAKALYGRIDLEIHLKPLRLPTIKNVFVPARSLREVAELYMAIGGVPKYLEMIDPALPVRANIERLCFSPEGFLVNEFERIFASHFGTNRHYPRILTALSEKSFANRDEIQKACRLASGGTVTRYLEDLELAGFVEAYAPVDSPGAVRGRRYRIVDPYLLFYFRFIRPALRRIRASDAEDSFSTYVSEQRYQIWRGLAFEALCRQHHRLVAEKLQFGAVRYDCGAWFSRHGERPGVQIDLLFIRADQVVTLCEIKFRDRNIGTDVIAEVERKRHMLPNPRNRTIETVLVTASAPTEELRRERYFNRILQLEDIFA